MKNRYNGPMRPVSASKSWLEGDGFKSPSWAYDQIESPPIYLPPSYYKSTYAVINDMGYPYDMMDTEYPDVFVDLLVNTENTIYDLNG